MATEKESALQTKREHNNGEESKYKSKTRLIFGLTAPMKEFMIRRCEQKYERERVCDMLRLGGLCVCG